MLHWKDLPDAAVVEIIESGASTVGKRGADTIVATDQVRINGQPVLVTNDVVVHGSSSDALSVTLTLFARRVTLGAELDLPPREFDVLTPVAPLIYDELIAAGG